MTCIFARQVIAVDRRDMSPAPHLMLNGMWEKVLAKRCQELVAQMANRIIFDVVTNFGWYVPTLPRSLEG